MNNEAIIPTRVERQERSPIRVIIANPPYNAGQANENDNNKNRKYPGLERRVNATYGEASRCHIVAQAELILMSRRFAYASDRIGGAGIVCYVNNNSFVAEKTLTGCARNSLRTSMRSTSSSLAAMSARIRNSPATTHNVFGIQVGVSINLFVRLPKKAGARRRARIHYHAVPVDWARAEIRFSRSIAVDCRRQVEAAYAGQAA